VDRQGDELEWDIKLLINLRCQTKDSDKSHKLSVVDTQRGNGACLDAVESIKSSICTMLKCRILL
jgi:hypothetical protein